MDEQQDEQQAALEARVARLETETMAQLDAILRKYHPVSVEHIDKVKVAIRESMNHFSAELVKSQGLTHLQNQKIQTLAGEVAGLKQQIAVLSAMTQGGMAVPRG